MGEYSQEKFLGLKQKRQVQIVLNLILDIEKHWGEESCDFKLNLLADYLLWAQFHQTANSYLNHFPQNLALPEINLRQLLDLAVPLERYLEISRKDPEILGIISLDRQLKERKTYPISIVLDHLRSSFNVGSIFRSAECLGIEHIYLVGYTPTPMESGVEKTAMGADKFVSWSSHFKMEEVITLLKQKSRRLVGLETTESAQNLEDYNVTEPLSLFIGNERFGLSHQTLSLMDDHIMIPMAGVKNSLNVANCASLVTYELAKNWRKG